MFLKKSYISSKIKRSKVTEYAALSHAVNKPFFIHAGVAVQLGEQPLFFLNPEKIPRLTLCILMDFPIQIDTIRMRLSIKYFKRPQVAISK